jgi:hypothetical protein
LEKTIFLLAYVIGVGYGKPLGGKGHVENVKYKLWRFGEPTYGRRSQTSLAGGTEIMVLDWPPDQTISRCGHQIV